MYDLIPINSLEAGQTAKVGHVIGQIDQIHRLKELGLRDGAQIQMVSPGSPCIVRLDGQRLCFRDSELLNIFVRPTAAKVG